MKPKTIGILTCFFLTALIGSVFVACSGGEPEVESFDVESPWVSNVLPGENANNVSVNTEITVNFSEAMYPETIYFSEKDDDCSGSLQLSNDNFNSCVPMSRESLMYSQDNKSFTVSPQSQLLGYSTYKIRVTEDAKDLALNRMENRFEMTTGFETGEAELAPNQAQAIYFGDENTEEFQIRGTIKIERALDETGIDGYTLYWGSGPSEKLAGEPPISSFLVSDSTLEYTLTDMSIPAGATHFLVYTYNGSGESGRVTFLDIPDSILRMVADINVSGGSNPHSYKVWNNKLYFAADDGVNGSELWEYDGFSSPVMTADIWIGANSSMLTHSEMVVFNNNLYFKAREGGFNNWELWRYDGMMTNQVYDINTQIDGGSTYGSMPDDFALLNGKLFFKACNGATNNGCELWFFDGAMSPIPAINIDMVNDIVPGTPDSFIDSITLFNGKLYFGANDATFGNELWWYDGTTPTASRPANLDVVYNINTGASPSTPKNLVVYDNRLIFSADDGVDGVEVWYYDGTPSPILGVNIGKVGDINPGISDSFPKGFIEHNGRLFFAAMTNADGEELWVYDGTGSPYMAADIQAGAGSSNPSYMTRFGPHLFFTATTTEYGTEVHGYNDMDNSSFRLTDINSGPAGSMPEFLTEFNGRLYFSADDGVSGKEMWVFYSE